MSNANARTAILVAGMHRSGTSAATGALAHFGVALGEKLLEPAEDNPKGYWENERAVFIHEALLHGLGRHWADARALPEGWRDSAAARRAGQEIRELIDQEFADAQLWAVKDPRACRFLPLWLDALNDRGVRAAVLIVARKPSEVAASIRARNGWSPAVGRLLWLRHVLDAEAASVATIRTAITYDQLLADPQGTIGLALRRLGMVVAAPVDDIALGEFVDRSIRHFDHDSVSAPEGDRDRMAALADAAFGALSAIAAGGEDWSSLSCVRENFEAWRTECGEYIDALDEKATMGETRYRGLQDDVAVLRSALNAQIAWSEDAVKAHTQVVLERDDLAHRLKNEEAHATALETSVADHATAIEGALRRIDALSSQLAANDETIAQSEHQISHLRETQQQAESEIAQLHAAQKHAESEIARLQDAQRNADREIARLQDAQRNAEGEIVQLYAAQRHAENEIARLHEAQCHAEVTIVGLNAERDKRAVEMAALVRDLAESREDAGRLRDGLVSVTAERDARDERVAILEASIREMTETLSWRATKPLRMVRSLLKRTGWRVRGEGS